MKIIEFFANYAIALSLWGYPILFCIMFLESIPIFGLFIPGQTIIMIAGFFAELGIVNFWPDSVASTLGVILGDMTGYLIGRKWGHNFIVKYGKYLWFNEDSFKEMKLVLRDHIGKTIILGRFNSFTRTFAPFVAGASKIKFAKYMLYNVIGGISWTVCFVLVGYLFGQSYQIAAKYIQEAFVIIAIVMFLALYIFIVNRKRRKMIKKYKRLKE